MAAGRAKCFLQRVEFRRRHAHVHSAFGHGQDIDAGVVEKLTEVFAQGVVENLSLFAQIVFIGMWRNPTPPSEKQSV